MVLVFIFETPNDAEFNRVARRCRYRCELGSAEEIAVFEKVVGRAKCMIGKHRRSRKHRVYVGMGGDTSKCSFCGVPMRSTASGWIVDKG